jgi:predicted NAD-dependent protein-ADP-ribosyltransferase YbiA (DUF1768 family)
MAEVAEVPEVPDLEEDEEVDVQSQVTGESEAEAEAAPMPKSNPEVVTKKAKKEKEEKKKRPVPIPKDSKGFFRARRNDVKAFDFTPEGDLQVPELRGVPAKVIKIPFYTPTSQEELREIDDKRQIEIESTEEEFNEALKNLREAMTAWRETGVATPVIQFQRELAKLDAKRSSLRNPVRWIKTFKNPTIRDINFENRYEDRKIGYDLSALSSRHYTPEQLFKKSDLPPPKPVLKIDVKSVKKDVPIYVVFYDPNDPTNGFLAPDTITQFVFNGTKYISPLQAFEAERMSYLKRTDKRKLILLQKTGKAIRTTATSVVGEVENPVELWTKILKTLIAQHPMIGEKLRETESDMLVFADPVNGRAGIGLAANDPNVREESKWTGDNQLGKAWMAARSELPEGEELEAQEGGSYGEDGTLMLKEEAKKELKGVLINRYRMKQNYP